ncbi:hypothetical protein KR093_008632, partial [Drosophila rubida]
MEFSHSFHSLYCVVTLAMLGTVLILKSPILRRRLQLKLGTMHHRLINYTPIGHMDILSPVSRHRLRLVKRKTLVLDMDDTLIKSYFDYSRSRSWRRRRPPKTSSIEPDFSFYSQSGDVHVSVYKRPHLDYFLKCVAKWYNVMIFTAATKSYAARVLDHLDGDNEIFQRRLYRHNCIDVCGLLAKYVSLCDRDATNVVLIDDSHVANSFNVGNSLHIKPYKPGSRDEELLALLPFLDALRFTHDVRSVLGRVTRYDCLTT